MDKIFYDLHIHSCLSPCADNMMTPSNIAGFSKLNGLDIVALTDHNSCKNCPAFFDACHSVGITPIAGMELETAEEIHLVCLFYNLESAMAFSNEVEKHRLKIKNKPEIFGKQLIMDADDGIVGQEADLLITATDLGLSSAAGLVKAFNGVVFPAHIDRPSNGIIEILGTFPPEPSFHAAEFNDSGNIESYKKRYPKLEEMVVLTNSDAHSLEKINESKNFVLVDSGCGDEKEKMKQFLDYIKGNF